MDWQVIVSYLEDMDAASIGEITGLTPGNVAMRIHGLRRFWQDGFTKEATMQSDPKRVWQDQETEATMTLERVREKAQALRGKTRRALFGWIAQPLLIAGPRQGEWRVGAASGDGLRAGVELGGAVFRLARDVVACGPGRDGDAAWTRIVSTRGRAAATASSALPDLAVWAVAARYSGFRRTAP